MMARVTIREFSLATSEKSLYALEDTKKGDVLFKFEGHLQSFPTRSSIQIGENTHIDWDNGYFAFLNHSCDPNCQIDFDNLTLIARKDIKAGEELFFNYNSSEYDMAAPFECLCGNPNCVKHIKGYKYLTEQQKRAIDDYVAPHLKKIEIQGEVLLAK